VQGIAYVVLKVPVNPNKSAINLVLFI